MTFIFHIKYLWLGIPILKIDHLIDDSTNLIG